MDTLSYRDQELHVEDVPVGQLAERHGTPLYVYSRSAMRAQFRALAQAMAEFDPLICYSVKANSNRAVLRTFLKEGAGLDIVSGGELYRALHAGAEANCVVFAGVGKTREEIDYALREGIRFFTVESEPEAERIAACARAAGTRGRIAFRVNPDVDPKTHRYISTGKKENKFGLDLERAAEAYEAAGRLDGLEIVGLHMHIGSQILSPEPFAYALEKVSGLCGDLKARFSSFTTLDIGGGLGIRYEPDQEALDPRAYADTVGPLLRKIGLSLVIEPGRSLVGNAGILLCRVQYVKQGPEKTFVVVDGAMNDLIRPSLYDAYHDVLAVVRRDGTVRGDLVGPICESGDFLASDRDLPAVEAGDLVAVCSAGAYGFSMASNYNRRPRPAEIMVEGGGHAVIRQRETWDDLLSRETEAE